MGKFNELSTVKLHDRLLPFVEPIYRQIIPGCKRQSIRGTNLFGGCLDVDFGIDAFIYLPDRSFITVQEKLRKFREPQYRDFTQERKNAARTIYENDGEWFKLGAQLYFYAWGRNDLSGFVDWKLLDIAELKLTVARQGGLDRIGVLNVNKKYGKADFYGIPFERLKSAIIAQYSEFY